MIQVLKNKFFAGAFIAAFAVIGALASSTHAFTTSAGTNSNTTLSSDTTMNPPILGYVPVGCDYGVGTVYSPLTGESCSVNGVTVTPPIVMMPPYDANGCGGGPYSITTGITCPGATPGNGTSSSSSSSSACAAGMIKVYSSTTGKPYCSGQTPVTSASGVKVSSTTDIRGIQNALNHVLGANLSVALIADGKKGPRTTAAIVLFQKWAGITADGKVGPITLGKLNASVK